MDTLAKILRENIGIDFLYGKYDGMQHRLDEVHGYVPNLEEYLDCIAKACYNEFTELIKIGSVNFTIDESAFADMEKKFFDNALFNLTLSIGPSSETMSAYKESESGIYNGKKFVKFEINIEEPTLIDLIGSLNRIVSHELLHAYQDMSTIEKSGRRSSGTINTQRYSNIVQAWRQYRKYPYMEELTLLLYNTEPIEINAFIGEIKSELLNNKEFIDGSKKAEQAIRETDAYQRLDNCWNTIETFSELTNKTDIENIVFVYNEIFDTKIQSYQKIIKTLISRVERFTNKVMEQASKIAYDVFAEKKQHLIR